MQAHRKSSSASWFIRLSILGLFVLAAIIPSRAERLEDLPKKPTDYVQDFAHVLSPEAVDRLGRLCGQLDHSATNAQIAIVTVNNLGGDDIDDFSNRLATEWSMGRKGTGRGLLILLAIQDHKRRIEVGGGLQGILTDATTGDIGRAMVPDLRRGDYDGALTLALTQIANRIAADAHVSLQDQPRPEPQMQRPPPHRGSSLGSIVFVVIIILVVLLLGGRGLFGFFLGMLLGGSWGGRGGGWGGGGYGGGFGGGGGGGSSGGDGFSGMGGGGDFDGGGSSGDW
jgi:uncharacterized protein